MASFGLPCRADVPKTRAKGADPAAGLTSPSPDTPKLDWYLQASSVTWPQGMHMPSGHEAEEGPDIWAQVTLWEAEWTQVPV